MKREDFIKIIKLRSFWKIDKRRGNYKLPNGEHLTSYVYELIDSQLEVDKLGILPDGNLAFYDKENGTLMIPFGDNVKTDWLEQVNRAEKLARDIVG